MASKLRKALGAVKDHTSIGFAKVSKSTTCTAANLDVLVLKATTHEEVPVDERNVAEILYLVSATHACATACVRALARRIDRTHNWVVALKCLQLLFRAFQLGDSYFHSQVLVSMRRPNSRLLNLSGFRDESAECCPWDYTAFVRNFGLYLEQRLHCVLLGKLRGQPSSENHSLGDVKPQVILDRIAYWQDLLDCAIATIPTGPARHNRLVQMSLGSIVLESVDVYRDISDGVDVLVDGFFRMPQSSRVEAYRTCGRAEKQFKELSLFYNACQSIGLDRKSNFPDVRMISGTVLGKLKDIVEGKGDEALGKNLLGEKEAGEDGEEKSSDASTEWMYKSDDGTSSDVETVDLMVFDDDQPDVVTASSNDEWERILLKSASDISNQTNDNHANAHDVVVPLDGGRYPLRPLNPFLESSNNQAFTIAPTFRACSPNNDPMGLADPLC